MAFEDADAALAGGLGEGAAGGGAGVEDGGHGETGVGQRDGGAVGVVVGGDEHGAVAGGYGPVAEVVAHRAGQHDAGAVVVGEGQRALDGAGGEDDAAGADAPEAAAGEGLGRRLGAVVGALLGEDVAVVIDAAGGGSGAAGDIRHGVEGGQLGGDPVRGGLVVDAGFVHGSTAAPVGRLFQNKDLRAAARCRAGGGEAGCAAAYDEDVGVDVEVFVVVGVGAVGGGAEAGGAADGGLEEMLPGGAGGHEGLVVEACWQEGREVRGGGAEVEREAGPVVLAAGGQALVELGGGGPRIGLEAAALAEGDKRVGLLDAAGNDAARAMVLEGTTDQDLAIGEEGGGEGVAGEAAQGLVVPAELQRFRAIYQPAAGGEAGAHGW